MPSVASWKKIFLLCFTLGLLSSCQHSPFEGKFIGSYTDFRTEKPSNESVWIQIFRQKQNSPEEIIEYKSVFPNPSSPLTYLKMTLSPQGWAQTFDHQLNFTVFGLDQEPTVLHLKKNQQTPSQKLSETQCFSGKDTLQKYRALLCINDADLSINLNSKESKNPILRITGSRFLGTDETAKFEDPRDLTLDEAVGIAMKQATELLIENQVVFRAQRAAMAGKYALIPHLSLSETSLAVFDPLGFLSILGDIAPFLFPAHWIRASEGPLRVKIELDAARIIKINLASQIQQLAFLYNRDQTTYSQREKIINRWNNEVIPLVRRLESQGLIVPQSTELLVTHSNQATENLKALSNLVQQDLYALSLALGFVNPMAVSDVDIGIEEEPIDTAHTCDTPKELGEQGYRVSIERRQLENTKLLAFKEKSEIYFNWFDPDGNSSTALGPALIEQIQISQSKIKELEIKTLQIQKSIFNTSAVACMDYNRSLNSYNRVRKIRVERQELFDSLMSDLREAETLNQKFETPPQSLADAFDNLLVSIEELSASIGSYRIYRTQLQRLLLTARFRDILMPDVGVVPDLRLLQNLPLGIRKN